jgi:hypothetical protein
MYEFWTNPPPTMSARCSWWVDRVRGGFRRNKRLKVMDYSDSAAFFGVYVWEWLNVLWPMFYSLERGHGT